MKNRSENKELQIQNAFLERNQMNEKEIANDKFGQNNEKMVVNPSHL